MIFQLLFFASLSFAQSTADGIFIRNAENMYSDTVKKTMRLKGGVQIGFKQQSLSCDTAMVNFADNTIEAEGKVILETLKVHIEASKLKFNYKTNVGTIYNGFVKSGQVVFEGDVIEKTGENTYIAQKAEFTACETCPPGWAFSGRTIEAEMGGYAYIKRPVFKVGGVPIFIFPAMTVPLKTTRQTGFLVPEMSQSQDGGLAISQSFFWAIDKSRDFTITGTNYEKRGWKAHGDLRFVMSESSKGRLESAFINDRAIRNQYRLSKSVDRWFAHYQHQFELPDEYISRADFKPVSDLRYPRDFQSELPGLGDPALENKFSITKNWEETHVSVAATMNTNLLKYYPLSDNSDAVHRMPEMRLSSREKRLGTWGPMFRWDLKYVNFTRDRYTYDDLMIDPARAPFLTGNIDNNSGTYDIIRDGIFNQGTDLVRTGQRMDFQPSVSYPFQLFKRFDILPSIKFRETQYRFDVPRNAVAAGFNETAARRYVQADITAKTEFSALINPDSGPNETRWKHSFEPEMSYSSTPWIRSPVHPFFGNYTGLPFYRQMHPISDADVVGDNRLQFDYEDRVYDRRLMTAAVTNKLVRKRYKNGDPAYDRVALFRVWQSFDFAQETTGKLQPWSPIDALLNLRFDFFESYATTSYNPYAHVVNVSASTKFKLNEKNYILLFYTHSYLFDDRNRVLPNTETRDYGGGLGFTSRYLDMGGLIDHNQLTGRTQSFEGFVTLRPPGNCWNIKVVGRQDLGGDRSVHFSFGFDFSGGQQTSATVAQPTSATPASGT